MSGHKCKIPNVCLSEKNVRNKIHLRSSPVKKNDPRRNVGKISEVFTGKGISGQTEGRIMCVLNLVSEAEK
jgi:hypothetical protein